MTERARMWFTKALIGAAGVAVITCLGWFVTTHINLMSESREKTAIISDHEDSIKAQWGIIARLQESNMKLSIQVSTLTRIQSEIIIPTLREANGKNIQYEIPLLGRGREREIEIYSPEEIESAPEFQEEKINPEEFSIEQVQRERITTD